MNPPKIQTDLLGRERRTVAFEAELREEDGKAEFVGHAAVFNRKANIADLFLEQVAPDAFRKTIQESDVRMLFNHNPDLVLARNRSGTLRLSQDDVGLKTEADLDRRQTYANDLSIAMERGDVDQMSFGFRVVKDEWDFDSHDLPLRTIVEAQLFDVSPVTYPAYVETDAAIRSEAFDLVAEKLGLTDEQRTEILSRLARGESPNLEAAGEAPQEEAPSEPVVNHSLEALKLKHRLNAKKYAA